MSELPQPATVVEMYLAAILAELQAIRNDIRTWPNNSVEQSITDALVGGEIDLKEPKRLKTKSK